jgi:hypothetical protein
VGPKPEWFPPPPPPAQTDEALGRWRKGLWTFPGPLLSLNYVIRKAKTLTLGGGSLPSMRACVHVWPSLGATVGLL